MKNHNTRWGTRSFCHPELDSGSSTLATTVRKQRAWKIPNQVWNDAFNKRGFTLIELLVVVLIIGILAAVALPQYNKAVMRSRYATLKNMTEALYQAEQIYFMEHGSYAAKMDQLDIQPTGCTLTSNKHACTFEGGYCSIFLESARVHCENTGTLKNAYVRYFKDRGPSCWALTGDKTDKYHKLCEDEGGVYRWRATCTSTVCDVYALFN